jgi:hypothetical protein
MQFSLNKSCALAACLAILSGPAFAQTAAQSTQMLNNTRAAVNTATAVSPEAAAAQAQARSNVGIVHNTIRTDGQTASQNITQNLNMDGGDQAYHAVHPQVHSWRTLTQNQKLANQQIYNHNDDEASTNNYPRYRHFGFSRPVKSTSSTMAGYNQD